MRLVKVSRRIHCLSSNAITEKWSQLFRDPNLWWDNRPKNVENVPDFKHAITGDALWINASPPWVQDKLPLLETPCPGTGGFRARYKICGKKIQMNSFDFVAALKQCGKTRNLEGGKGLHAEAAAAGFHSDKFVSSALIVMYSKCGSMSLAQEVFNSTKDKDVVLWTSLISGYAENGESLVALDMLAKMDCQPNVFTFAAAAKACASLAASDKSKIEFCLERGKAIHQTVRELGLMGDLITATALIDMYSKCGSMKEAREIFEGMRARNVVTWTSLILGYAANGDSCTALDLFMSMDSCQANCFTCAAALKACGDLARAQGGKLVHAQICKQGFENHTDNVVANALVSFYGKCANMEVAEELLNCMVSPDIFSWTALIAGYSSLGESSHVFRLATKLRDAGLEMNSVTFICVLTACSHAGLVDDGKKWFGCMKVYGVSPTLEHCNCMVDLLGRANRLQEALSLIQNMPFKASDVTWTTLLGACKKWSNLETAKVAFDAIVATNTKESAAYVLMSDIYEKLGMRHCWEEMNVTRRKKSQALCNNEGKAVEFVVGDSLQLTTAAV